MRRTRKVGSATCGWLSRYTLAYFSEAFITLIFTLGLLCILLWRKVTQRQWSWADTIEFHMSHDMRKQTKWVCAQRRLRSAWALLCAQWVAKDPNFIHADSEDSDQTGRMPRLIWVFAGHTLILLVLSCRGSYCPRHQAENNSNSPSLCLFHAVWLAEKKYTSINSKSRNLETFFNPPVPKT